MQYMFSCLVLGDPITAIEYLHEANIENIAQGEISQWNAHLSYRNDECDLEISIPVVNNVEYDEMIPMADGILYFINPNSPEQVELFKDLMNIIQKIRRDIPTIVIFRDRKNIIQLPSNQLLLWIWETYGFEAWIADYFTSNHLKEILETLAIGMTYGETLINYDTAWLQTPLLVKKANQKIVENKFGDAARMVAKIAFIARKMENSDWTIYAEQAAWLYSQVGDQLKAATMIKDFNPVYSKRFRKLYVDVLNSDGNKLYNAKQYTLAAQKYEQAGKWASIELKNIQLMKKSLKLAIYSWIAACEISNAFILLDKFDHQEMIDILEEITEKIAGSMDYLSSINRNDYAKSQLYLCFQRYQKVGLFDSIKILAGKAVKILKRILEKNIREQEVYAAKMSLEEIYNIWETFEIDKENLDNYLIQIGKLFVEKRDFQKVEIILSKIEKKELQNELTEVRMEEEEKINQEVKLGEIEDISNAINVLYEYIKDEALQYYNLNKNVYNKAERYISIKNYKAAAELIKNQADWLFEIGQEQLSFDVSEYLLDIYIQDHSIDEFLQILTRLSESRLKTYLKTKINIINDLYSFLENSLPHLEFENNISLIIKYYRNHLLYEESRIFADLLIKHLIQYAVQIAQNNNDPSILKAIEIIHQIENIAKSYFEDKIVNIDPIYSEIVNYYIQTDKLKEAREYNDKIIDKDISTEYFSRMDKIESEISSSIAQAAKERQQVQIDADYLSQLTNQARDQRMAQENLLRMRTGLKKKYFQHALEELSNNNPLDSAEIYFNSAKLLANTKKFELAGISAGVGLLIYLMLKDTKLLKIQLDDLEKDLGLSSPIFHETFPVKISDYILQMIDAKKAGQIKSALNLFKILALFPEEQLILDTLLGNDANIQTIFTLKEQNAETVKQLPTNYFLLLEKIVPNIQLQSRRRELELKFWGTCQDHFARQEYEQAFNSYLDTVENLITRNYIPYAIDSIIMAFLSLLKVKHPTMVYREFEKYMFRLSKTHERLVQIDIFKLLDMFLQYFNIPSALEMLKEISNSFQTKLELFDWECALINSLILQMSHSEDQSEESQSKEGIIASNEIIVDDTLLSQQIIVLTQDLSKNQDSFTEVLNKREKLKRTYYEDIIEEITAKNFLEASLKYKKIAKRMARRNDFETASLMILLATLAQIKNSSDLHNIQEDITTFLESLGLVKKILSESYGVKIAFFIFDALALQSESIKFHLNNLLNQLPLLEEEMELINL